MAEEDRRIEAKDDDVAYKTKVVQFFGRSTPIILQNENGPCPLIAICNVLLLRNSINLSLDAPEVPLQKLLSLVAEKLIDSNSSLQEKDEGYLINQQQNVSDAIDLLSRLATGIDVNVQFRKINDFEFTRECSIFDLLDIGLYHGWIVDPQDAHTAAAIGSKSYNALAGELVAFEAEKLDDKNKKPSDADFVDFAAATTATLGVPSPSLSRSISFDYCHESLPVDQRKGKGDIEEEAVLMRVLNMSKVEVPSVASDSIAVATYSSEGTKPFDVSACEISSCSNLQLNKEDSEKFDCLDKIVSPKCNASSDCRETEVAFDSRSNVDFGLPLDFAYSSIYSDQTNNMNNTSVIRSAETYGSDGSSSYKVGACPSGDVLSSLSTSIEESSVSRLHNKTDNDATYFVVEDFNDSAAQLSNFKPQFERNGNLDVSEIVSDLTVSEPIYEGEERMFDSSLPAYGNREPVYEGEMVLAEQASITGEDTGSLPSDDQVTEQKCQLIKNFLERTANQLTIYGLFCLQEGLKERELCVFFRNNHFSTMFKFNGELYLLVTDQGYLNQPELVWEKLNEVNGDTVFMTGNFTQFRADGQVNDSWNEQNAISSTADYLATLETVPSNASFNSDFQLAIALQQQEFEHQPQQQLQEQSPPPPSQQQKQPQSTQPPSGSGRSRLVTGPQVSKTTNMPHKSESKLREKCTVM